MKEETIKKGAELIILRDKYKKLYNEFKIDMDNNTVASVLFRDEADSYLYSVEDKELVESSEMKASEMITRLQALVEKYGDQDVWHEDNECQAYTLSDVTYNESDIQNVTVEDNYTFAPSLNFATVGDDISNSSGN